MKKVVTIITAAFVTSIYADAFAAENARKLSGAQIRAKFTGMQITDEVHFRTSTTATAR